MVALQLLLLFMLLNEAVGELKCYNQEFTAIKDIKFDENKRKLCKNEACFMSYEKENLGNGKTKTEIKYGCDMEEYCRGHIGECKIITPLSGKEITHQLCCCKGKRCEMLPFETIPARPGQNGSKSSKTVSIPVFIIVAASVIMLISHGSLSCIL